VAVTGRPVAVFLGGGMNLVDRMKLDLTNPTCWSM
jgi:CO/xanthine dehydrogenase FAD-binding subunit